MFDGDLEKAKQNKGMSIRIEKSDSTLFFVEAIEVLNQNWHTSSGEPNFSKIFTVRDVGRIDAVSTGNCPG